MKLSSAFQEVSILTISEQLLAIRIVTVYIIKMVFEKEQTLLCCHILCIVMFLKIAIEMSDLE